MPMRHHKPLELTDDERRILEQWARRPKASPRLALRARVVLACGEGLTNRAVATRLHLSSSSVSKWRERFRVRRLEGLTDEPRRGAPRIVSDERVVDVITRTLEGPPPRQTPWSAQAMAEAAGLRDIVGLYLSPPDHALVLCVDENSQGEALERSRPLLPIRPGISARQTGDDFQHAPSSRFATPDVAIGEVLSQHHGRHRHRHRQRQQEFLTFLQQLDTQVPPTGEIHIILDNYDTHRTPAIARWFAQHPRYHVHFTPTSASWMNEVERFFAQLTTQYIRRGRLAKLQALEAAIAGYLAHHNQQCKPFVWTATADVVLDDDLTRFYERASETRH